MQEFSPSGKVVCQSSGPLDAEIVGVGESPAADEMKAKPRPEPFVGRAGKVLNSSFVLGGIDRGKVRLINLVPVRAPKDKFVLHDSRDVEWGRERLGEELSQLKRAKVFLALGANPTEWLLGGKPPVANYGERDKEGFIGEWRGSVIPTRTIAPTPFEQSRPESYIYRLPFTSLPKSGAVIIPTYHPAAVARRYEWHPWLNMDVALAARIAREGVPKTKYRQWFINQPGELQRILDDHIDLIAVDSEMSPEIISIATADQVHVFVWDEQYRNLVEEILTSNRIVKVAHNWPHDYAWFRVKFGVYAKRPLVDTQGVAHDLHSAMQKALSPHIASRYTNWPYHKWLVNIDPLIYCGMDSVVCYDAYWPQMEDLVKRKLMPVAEHDHKLMHPLMEMQEFGFRIDEGIRLEVARELKAKLDREVEKLGEMVQPVIVKNLHKFEKPHLFKGRVKCPCCGGGTKQRLHCIGCSSYGVDNLTIKEIAKLQGLTQKATWEWLGICRTCGGFGKVDQWLEFNSDSSDQLADIIYRGLGIKARKFKGKETIKAASLDPIKDKHPIIGQIISVSAARADFETVERLTPGIDSRLHCVFDPWGTGSGRVASKESLVEPGTNAMNLPKEARRFVIPDPGHVFLYPDMAQIEARAVAVLSKDPKFLAAFKTPVDWPGNKKHGVIDSHTSVVKFMLEAGVRITRDQAKRLVYAWMYGGGASQVTVELNAEAFRKNDPNRLTTEQVQVMFDTLNFKVFPGVYGWQQEIVKEVASTRRLRCPLTGREFEWLGYIMDPKTKELKHEIKKQVWSRLPQNMAAWILALGLLDLRASDAFPTVLRPLIHVHDAVVIQTPRERVKEGEKLAIGFLSREIWGMNFTADMKVGDNWLEASASGDELEELRKKYGS